MRKLILFTMVIAFFAVVNNADAKSECSPGEIVIKFSHVTNTDKHPKGIAASLLEKRVNEEMEGKACLKVYPSSTLYNDNKVLEAMLQGDVQLAAPSLSKFENITKKYRVFDLPFLFKDINAVNRFQASKTGQALKNAIRKRGLQGLAFWHNGMKQISANKPLLRPSDAKGLKFRVQPSDVLVAQFEALGAIPQKLAFSEVYGALQLGVVDGQENTWSNILSKKFFEVQDGITESNHGILDYLVVASTKWLKGLPADVRKQFLTILAEVTESRNSESYNINQENKKALIAQGVKVRKLTSSQRAEWIKAMKPVWSKFEKDIGTANLRAAIKSN